MQLSRDFREFLQSLNDNGVRYLVIGGYAVALHGHPRYTKYLDVWIEPNAENAERILAALKHSVLVRSTFRRKIFSKPGKSCKSACLRTASIF